MNFFSISDIENLTNIKAHTLRIWEQRYGLTFSKRKDSSHRYYDAEDLKQILRVAWLYHRGHRISKIACLNAEEIRKLALGDPGTVNHIEIIFNRLLEASIDINDQQFNEVLQSAIEQFGFEQTVFKIIFPFLEKLGLFWLTGHIIPAQEHFASNSIVKSILLATDRLEVVVPSQDRPPVVLFSPEGEYHEIPLLFMNYLLRKNGIPVAYMGTNTAIDTLQDYCRQKKVRVLYFHLITNLTRRDAMDYLKDLSAALPEQTIYCSGCCVDKLSSSPENIVILRSNEAISNFTSS